MTLPRIKTTYAIIDVMAGRKKLAKHIAKHGPVRVLIEAEIIAEWVGMRTPGLRRYNDWSYCFKGDEQCP